MHEDEKTTPQKLMPQELEAEQALLGACLIEHAALKSARIAPEDFYRTAHRVIFEAFLSVDAAGLDLDLVTAAAELRKDEYAKKLPKDFGAGSYLSALVSQVPTAANFRAHERLVIDAAQRRAVIHAAADAQQAAYDGAAPNETIAAAVSRLNDIRDRRSDIVSVPYRKLVLDGHEAIERNFQAAREGRLVGIPTGFPGIDRLTNGFQPWFYVLAGRTGKGKTSLAMQMARAAGKAGHPAGIISIEMDAEQLAVREISSESRVPLKRLISGRVWDQDWPEIAEACGRLADLPIRAVFSAFHADSVETAIDHLVQAHGCRIVFVDYLQLLSIRDHTGTREQEVSKISHMHKQKAKQHRTPIVALAQLNRAVETRQDKRPVLSDLRESGSLEQDADVVAFVHQDECKCPMTVECFCGNRHRAWYLQRKGRMNGTGDVPLEWDGKTTTFTDISEAAVEGAEAADGRQ